MEKLIYHYPIEDPENGYKVKVFEAEVFSGYPRVKVGNYYVILEKYESGKKSTHQFWIHVNEAEGFNKESEAIRLARKWYDEVSQAND